MCGLAGILCGSAIEQKTIQSMGDCLAHRGPDDSGYWVDQSYAVALIHRRLSILDLSQSGHQPMHSFCDRYIIVFNGEIYNHLNIRKKLKFSDWRGTSDTETLLAAISELGIDKALKLLVGMFAFALWDKKERELFLARDRFGEKPLYYGWCNDVFLFGSELKSLKSHAAFNAQIDRSSLMSFMENGYIAGPDSIYQGIKKLPQGTWGKVSFKYKELVPVLYWEFRAIAENGQDKVFQGNDDDAIKGLESLLSHSILSQEISDVPIGAFLSGGVDSSTIVALMQKNSDVPVNTFALGYYDKRYNEATYAKDVAKYLGTNHTDIYATHEDAMSVISKLPQIYCEPFADTSQIPTLLVSQLAREHVTVALSGDAGDELFAGYNHYNWVSKVWPKVNTLPLVARKLISAGIMIMPAGIWNSYSKVMYDILGKAESTFTPSNRMETLARFLRSGSMVDAYYSLVANCDFSHRCVLHEGNLSTGVPEKNNIFDDDVHQMMYLDTVKFLTDDILVKTDRAAMAVGLETRIPMLDPSIVEFVWSQPLNRKIRNGESKWLLRQVLYKYVPKELIERPKMGFGAPIDEWLRGPLFDWAESLLDPNKIRQQGYLDVVFVRKIWHQHSAKKYNWGKQLWSILMFQAWLDSN